MSQQGSIPSLVFALPQSYESFTLCQMMQFEIGNKYHWFRDYFWSVDGKTITVEIYNEELVSIVKEFLVDKLI